MMNSRMTFLRALETKISYEQDGSCFRSKSLSTLRMSSVIL